MNTDRARLQEGKPEWAVALDKMRDYYGNEEAEDVTLTAAEAIAFVRHYLATSAALNEAVKALREIRSVGQTLSAGIASEALERMGEK